MEIEDLLRLLEVALKQGYSVSSSPLVPILEIQIDLCLRLAQFFQEGGPFSERNNPSLKELPFADELGNPKIVKLFEIPRWVHSDPQISEFFRKMAGSFVRFKKTGRISSFMEETPSGPLRPTQRVKGGQTAKRPKEGNYYFFLRRREARRKQKSVVNN
jgi:hypothetical protein